MYILERHTRTLRLDAKVLLLLLYSQVSREDLGHNCVDPWFRHND